MSAVLLRWLDFETVTKWCPNVMLRLFHSHKSKVILRRHIHAMGNDLKNHKLDWAKHNLLDWLLLTNTRKPPVLMSSLMRGLHLKLFVEKRN